MLDGKRRAIAATATMMLSVGGAVFFAGAPAQAANTCTVTPKAGVSSVAIRNGKGTGETAVSYLRPGQHIRSRCSSEDGGYYSACGGSSYWFWVEMGDFDRFVAAGCVKLTVDRT